MFEQNVIYGPGTSSFTTHTFEILIMLGVAFLLGLWLGWIIWSRYRQTAEQARLENNSLTVTANALRTETEQLRNKLIFLETSQTDLNNQLALVRDENEVFRTRSRNLETEIEQLHAVNRRLQIELGLTAAPDAPAGHDLELIAPPFEHQEPEPDMDTLAANAAAIAEAAEAAILDTQDDDSTAAILLSAEPHEDDTVEAPPVLEEPDIVSVPIVATGPRDDFKIIEGIGPKIEELLYKNDIHTYTELARTPVNRLKDILMDEGPRFAMHDPGTWSAQALLAANAEWENLKAYQEFLNAGKRPKQ